MDNFFCKKCSTPIVLECCPRCSNGSTRIFEIKNESLGKIENYKFIILLWDSYFPWIISVYFLFFMVWIVLLFITESRIITFFNGTLILFWIFLVLAFGFSNHRTKLKVFDYIFLVRNRIIKPPIIDPIKTIQTKASVSYDNNSKSVKLFKEKVYISSNPSMPGIVKIGKTKRDVVDRMRELYTTGVPTPFETDATIVTPDCDELEKTLHLYFNEFRVNSDREFFKIDKEVVITKSKEINEIIIQKYYSRK
jgi:hypothetical protein